MTGTIISGFSLVVAIVAAYFSRRSSIAARRGLTAGHLLSSMSEMFTALEAISDEAERLNTPKKIAESRSIIGQSFRDFSVASTRVALVEPIFTDDSYGMWIRGTLNNMATDLRQANEFAYIDLQADDDEPRPELHRRSSSYRSVRAVMKEIGTPEKLSADSALDVWWAQKIESVHNAVSDLPTVYDFDAPYVVQHARLLDDFVREYALPWAQSLARDKLK